MEKSRMRLVLSVILASVMTASCLSAGYIAMSSGGVASANDYPWSTDTAGEESRDTNSAGTTDDDVDVTSADDGAGPRNTDLHINVTYDPPDCPEGVCDVHLKAVTTDPAIVFCRWDLDGDGTADTPWSTNWTYDIKDPPDNIDMTVCVECWDGFSMITVVTTGTILGEPVPVDAELPVQNVGWRFKPKVDLTVIALGYWRNTTDFVNLSQWIWDYDMKTLLGTCIPPQTNDTSWNWCNLSVPIYLFAGASYLISCHRSTLTPPWPAIYSSRVSWSLVDYEGWYYSSLGMPGTYGGNSLVPKCDLGWMISETVPLSEIECTNCTVNNVPPMIVDADCSLEHSSGDVWLRIAGEKWHDVRAILYKNGTEVGNVMIVRRPGSPNTQEVLIGTIDNTADYTVTLLYTPDDDPVNGQPNGATPAWIILRLNDESEKRIHHTFNVRHPDTWVWTVTDLEDFLVGRTVKCTATATDQGMDDLTFEWDFGDWSPVVTSVHLNGGTFPFTATDVQTHTYATAGVYDVKVKVTDDDGGVDELMIVITII